MNINWNAFFVVGIATLVGALVVVTLFSSAVRLHAAALDRTGRTRTWTRATEYACYLLSALAVLYGIYLIIPIFHAKS
ncbi:MAG: hypothetical protein IIZ13_01815 [Renibacterium sp.]|nr:hypothetical protein [Renibacterium sp.]